MTLLWLILKIILWILLSILAVILILVCSILFLPIDYMVYAQKYRNISGDVHIRFFYLVTLIYKYREHTNMLWIKCCGITVKTIDLAEDDMDEPEAAPTKKTKEKVIKEVKNQVQSTTVSQEDRQIKKEVKTREAKRTNKKNTQNKKMKQNEVHSESTLDLLKAIWNDSHRKGAIKVLWKFVIDLLKYLKPRTLKFGILVGKADPADTGQLIAKLTMMYPLYYRYGWIEGCYDEAGIWGEGKVAGRIRLGTLLKLILVCILNKDIREIYKTHFKHKEGKNNGI